MKNSSTILNVIFVLALSGLVLCSRCDARIHALNKRIGMNSSGSGSGSARTNSSLPVVLDIMDSIHLYPVSIGHLARYCSTNVSAPAISPRLNPHTTSTETLVANARITFLLFLSSLEWNRSDSNRLCGIFRFHHVNDGNINRAEWHRLSERF